MPINRLLRQLMNDERVVQQLQDSKPIREAARAAVAAWHKGKVKVQDGLEKWKNSELSKKMEDKEYTGPSTYEQWKTRNVKEVFEQSPKKKS